MRRGAATQSVHLPRSWQLVRTVFASVFYIFVVYIAAVCRDRDIRWAVALALSLEWLQAWQVKP